MITIPTIIKHWNDIAQDIHYYTYTGKVKYYFKTADEAKEHVIQYKDVISAKKQLLVRAGIVPMKDIRIFNLKKGFCCMAKNTSLTLKDIDGETWSFFANPFKPFTTLHRNKRGEGTRYSRFIYKVSDNKSDDVKTYYSIGAIALHYLKMGYKYNTIYGKVGLSIKDNTLLECEDIKVKIERIKL